MAETFKLEGFTPDMFQPAEQESDVPAPEGSTVLEGFTADMFQSAEETSAIEEFGAGIVKGVDKLADVGRAVISAPWNIATGVAELAAGAIDITTGSDTLNDVSAFMERAGEPYKPKYIGGQLAEAGIEIGASLIPAIGWLNAASKTSRAVNAGKEVVPAASKFLRSAQAYGKTPLGRKLTDQAASRASQLAAASLPMSVGVGAGTFIFSPDGRPSISTTIEAIPLPYTDAELPLTWLYTEEDSGLTGRDNAERFFKNRLKKSIEQAGIGAIADAGLYGLGTVARTAPVRTTVRGGVTGAKRAADFFKDVADYAGTQVGQNALVQDMMGTSFGKAVSTKTKDLSTTAKKKLTTWLTPDGGADPFVSQMIRDTIDTKDAKVRTAIKALDEFHAATGDILKATRFTGQTRPGAMAVRKDLEKFLRGLYDGGEQAFSDKYGPKAARAATQMVESKQNLIDINMSMLDDQIARLPEGSDARRMAEEAKAIIQQNDEAGIGYLRRVYEAKENPVGYLTRLEKEGFDLNHPLYNKAIDEVSTFLGTLDETRGLAPEVIRQQAKELVNNTAGLSALNKPNANVGTVLRDAIESIKNQKSKMWGLLSADAPKLSVSEDFLIARKPVLEHSESLRKFLGEIDAPEEMYMRTVSDLSDAWAANKMYGEISVNQRIAPRLTQALEMIENGGRPHIIMMPSPNDISARNRLMQTIGRDDRTVQQALDDGDTTQAAMLEIRDRLGTGSVSDEVKFLDEATTLLSQRNYVPLAGLAKDEAEGFSTIFGGQFGSLQNAWVTPEMYSAFKTPLNLSPLSSLAAIAQQVRSFSQRMTIVPSIPGQVRNLTGNIEMLAMNGNLHRGTNLLDNFYIFTQSLDDVSDAGLQHMAQVANQSGLMDSSAIYNTLKEYQQFGREISAGKKLGKVLDRAEDFIPFMKMFDKIYAGQDTFFKLAAFSGEYNKYAKAFAKAGFRDDNVLLLGSLADAGIFSERTGGLIGLSPLEEGAAGLVKKTMPMYNMVAAGLRFVDRFPVVGNFTSFASENIRNIFNIADLGIREVSFSVPQGVKDTLVKERLGRGIPAEETLQAIRVFEEGVRANGSQRLVNSWVIINTVPNQLTRLSMKLTNTSEEELDALNSKVQDYMKGGDFVILDNDHKGNITFVDTSYHNPYGYIRAAVRAAIQSYNEKGTLGASEASQLLEGALGTFISKIADPFASETMMTERALNVTLRDGKTKTGATVYDPARRDESWIGERGAKAFLHLAEGMIPRYFTEFYEERGGELKEGKTLQAFKGMPTAQGTRSTPEAEFARMLTGLTPVTVRATDDIKYNAFEYQDAKNASLSAVKRIVKAGDTTREEKIQEFADLIEAYRISQNELYAQIEASRDLGATTKEIVRELVEEANMSQAEANSIARGELYIKPISGEFVNGIDRLKKDKDFQTLSGVPYDEMFDLMREALGTPLKAVTTAKEEGTYVSPRAKDATSGTFTLEGFTPEMFQQPSLENSQPLRGFTPEMFQQPSPAAPPAPGSQSRVDPAILGNDPATQALAKSLGRSQ